MRTHLKISAGQASDAGIKAVNQDFHDLRIPTEPQLTTKGIAIAIADGISSSPVSQQASQAAVSSFLADYYCTPDSWSVKHSAQKVLSAVNSWLKAQTQRSYYRYERDKGFVCTFSAMVIKSTTAHLFHAGDSRIYRVAGDTLEQLTRDHRVQVSNDTSYLARALGVEDHLDLDYRTLSLAVGDCFMLATDGIFEFVDPKVIAAQIHASPADLNTAADTILQTALANGSDDNLTIQIIRIDELPTGNADEVLTTLSQLPFAPDLSPRKTLDHYLLDQVIHSSSRSHVYQATDLETDTAVVLKFPSVELRDDPGYMERFLLEEWIARRIDNPHVLKPATNNQQRQYQYVAFEYVSGQTLDRWIQDHAAPSLAQVRQITEQIIRGLRAFHRQEMLHQDLRPHNVMIQTNGVVKIIDFGATRVAGLSELDPEHQAEILGTSQYTAPEYYTGELISDRSDQYSLGVIVYQMLTGQLPYGTRVAQCRTPRDRRQLRYRSVRDFRSHIPEWVDDAIAKAVNPDAFKRYETLSEFLHDLNTPNRAFQRKSRPPLIERDPVVFWQVVSALLTLVIVYLLATGAA